MKNLFASLLSITCIVLCLYCDLLKKDDPTVLGGDQSPMGKVGVTVGSRSEPISGVSNFSATVTALSGVISS